MWAPNRSRSFVIVELNKRARAHAAREHVASFSLLRKMRRSDQISHIELSNYRSGASIVSPAWKRIVTNSERAAACVLEQNLRHPFPKEKFIHHCRQRFRFEIDRCVMLLAANILSALKCVTHNDITLWYRTFFSDLVDGFRRAVYRAGWKKTAKIIQKIQLNVIYLKRKYAITKNKLHPLYIKILKTQLIF